MRDHWPTYKIISAKRNYQSWLKEPEKDQTDSVKKSAFFRSLQLQPVNEEKDAADNIHKKKSRLTLRICCLSSVHKPVFNVPDQCWILHTSYRATKASLLNLMPRRRTATMWKLCITDVLCWPCLTMLCHFQHFIHYNIICNAFLIMTLNTIPNNKSCQH